MSGKTLPDVHEVRRREEVQVQDVALQRLAVLGQEAQLRGLVRDGDAEGVLGRADAGQAVADGADAADPAAGFQGAF